MTASRPAAGPNTVGLSPAGPSAISGHTVARDTAGPRTDSAARRAARAAFGLGVAALALTLTGCEQPVPGATAWSGTTSRHVDATCWSEDGPIDLATCTPSDGLPEVEVLDGRVVGVSLDPHVAEGGWVVFLDNQPATQQPLTTSYWRVPFPGTLAASGATLRVVALDGAGGARGVWAWRLVPQQ